MPYTEPTTVKQLIALGLSEADSEAAMAAVAARRRLPKKKLLEDGAAVSWLNISRRAAPETPAARAAATDVDGAAEACGGTPDDTERQEGRRTLEERLAELQFGA